MSKFLFLLPILFFSCRSVSPNSNNNLLENDASRCRWRSVTSYDDLVEKALYKYDLDENLYTLPKMVEANLTAAQAAEDVDCLNFIFQTAYSATNYFKDKGVDLVALSANLRDSIASSNRNYSRLELMGAMKSLHKGAFDGHAGYSFLNKKAINTGDNARMGRSTGLDYPVFVFINKYFSDKNGNAVFTQDDGNQKEIKSCDNFKKVPVAMPELQTDIGKLGSFTFAGFRSVEQMEASSNITCTTATGESVILPLSRPLVGADVARTDEMKAKGALFSDLPNEIQYLRISSFPEPITDIQKQVADTIANTDKPLIIDARGVGGGSPPMSAALENAIFTANENFLILKSKTLWSALKLFGVAQTFKDLKEDTRYQRGMPEQQRTAMMDSLDNTFKRWNAEMVPETFNHFNLQSFDATAFEDDESKTGGKRASARAKPILLLIDRDCGSQCEFVTSYVRHHPKVKLIGVPTAGRLNMGSEGTLFLPNSKIAHFPSGAMSTHIPNAPEGEGISPDLYIFGANVVKIATQMIQTL